MDIAENTAEAYAYSYLDFTNAAMMYGRTGGFPQMKTLLDMLRDQAGGKQNTLTIDGGDLWQGSGTSLWTRGVDMVEASNILGLSKKMRCSVMNTPRWWKNMMVVVSTMKTVATPSSLM